ncbi:MAG TPA: hypothetical protein VF189_03865 [Patescibacteria group bacterium]
MATPEDLRASGVLSPEDQITVQNLYNAANAEENGNLKQRDENETVFDVEVTGRKIRSQSLEIFKGNNGYTIVKLRRGRQGWQYDGGHGLTGGIGDSSLVGGEQFSLTVDQRENLIKEASRRFLPKAL